MKEEEIRPKKIFDEYLRLAEIDTETFFADAPRENIACPACGHDGDFAFQKSGFTYKSCSNCLTLFCSPRPSALSFARYYTEAPSSKYWATTFYKQTAKARKEKLWKPKAFFVLEKLKEYGSNEHQVIDIGGGYGLFGEEIREQSSRDPIIIEPAPHLAAVCREKSLKVVEKFLEDCLSNDFPDGPRAFVSFELFEHLHDPQQFLSCVLNFMTKGDIFIFTTLSGTGVDIQLLWKNSKSVSPPHHLNFFNPNSIKLFLEKMPVEILNVTTPGKLDLDILANSLPLIKDRFWKSLIENSNPEELTVWQQFISEMGRSSHMMVVLRKA